MLVAAALVLEGRLIKGEYGFSGEFGHIMVARSSDVVCSCGKKGCLEALVSGRRIAALGVAKYNTNDGASLRKLTNNNIALVNAHLIGKAYKMGDKLAKNIFSEVTEYLAQAIGSLVNLLNTPKVYVGGVSLNGDFYFDMLNEKVQKYLLTSNKNMKIIPSTFGEQATTIGAACLILNKILTLQL